MEQNEVSGVNADSKTLAIDLTGSGVYGLNLRFRFATNETSTCTTPVATSDIRLKHNAIILMEKEICYRSKKIKTAEMYDSNYNFNTDTSGDCVGTSDNI